MRQSTENYQNVKKLLEKQLELLSERSHQKFTSDIDVALLSIAMVEIAELLY